MRMIALKPAGYYAIVDDADYEALSKFNWRRFASKRTSYAVRQKKIKGEKLYIYMHRAIIGAGKGQLVDHRNGHGLDNRRSNLRLCSYSENARNSRKRRDGSSPYRGVNWDKRHGAYVVRIRAEGKYQYLGKFDDPREGALVYNEAAKKHFGEFAYLNPV